MGLPILYVRYRIYKGMKSGGTIEIIESDPRPDKAVYTKKEERSGTDLDLIDRSRGRETGTMKQGSH